MGKVIVYVLLLLFPLCGTGQILKGVASNLSWRDSVEARVVFKEIRRYDYAMVLPIASAIEKRGSYQQIKTTYYVIGVMEHSQKAYRLEVDRYDVKDFKRFEESDTSRARYSVKKKPVDFDRAWSYFTYINEIGFDRLNKDSLSSHIGQDPSGQHVYVSLTHSTDEIMYLKAQEKVMVIRTYLPEWFISKNLKPYADRAKYVICRNRYLNLFWPGL